MTTSRTKTLSQKNKNARELALECLIQVVIKGRSLSELHASINEHEHAALVREMVFGVCRWFYYFETELKKNVKKPLRKKDHDVLLIIFLGMYQLQFMHTSDHAAVHETVNLVFKVRKKWAKGLVNAVLRTFSKHSFDEHTLDHSSSYAPWMVDKITNDWPNEANDIVKSGNQKAAIALRINAKKISPDAYLHSLKNNSISFELNDSLPHFVRLTQTQNVVQLPGFAQGEVYVQDASAQMASILLNVKSGMRVLDACAAPGGKSTHIAELNDTIDLVVVEKEASRIARLHDNLNRLGHKMTVLCGDAAQPNDWFKGELFDRILIDAPCSASGIIRRHPDIKVLRRAEDIAPLVQLQNDILTALWGLLKQGGELLYCTCSIFKHENEHQIAAFIAQHKDCSELKIEPFSWSQQRPFGTQVLPSKHGHDGFYYAKLIKALV